MVTCTMKKKALNSTTPLDLTTFFLSSYTSKPAQTTVLTMPVHNKTVPLDAATS